MSVPVPTLSSNSQQLQLALFEWDVDGGAGAWILEPESPLCNVPPDTPPLANAELVQLHIRVIALENLVTSLLSEASDRQRMLAQEMAAYISPRPGATQHPATVRAAAHMLRLVGHARHFHESSA